MKQTVLLCIAIFSCNIAYGQQNFINVPSSEVTKAHKLFFQQQININELIQSNTTIDYGLGKGFEIGANVLGLNFSEKKASFLNNDSNDVDPYNPLVILNGLKEFGISERIKLAVGAQSGINYNFNKRKAYATLVYFNLLVEDLLIHNSKLVLGTYYNSKHYGGSGNRVGIWLATEVPISQKLHLMAESVLGNNSLAYTSVGIIYYPLKWMPLTFGMQIPNTKKNSYSLVIELTICP
ncbi:MAG: hypothetical protein H7331_08500 [Bacteroidia bacterium]|nr:hypothetical protein [Bacteroidia bacterium]